MAELLEDFRKMNIKLDRDMEDLGQLGDDLIKLAGDAEHHIQGQKAGKLEDAEHKIAEIEDKINDLKEEIEEHKANLKDIEDQIADIKKNGDLSDPEVRKLLEDLEKEAAKQRKLL